jgi:hypothetical protein
VHGGRPSSAAPSCVQSATCWPWAGEQAGVVLQHNMLQGKRGSLPHQTNATAVYFYQ